MGRETTALRISTVRTEREGVQFSTEVLSNLYRHGFKVAGSRGNMASQDIDQTKLIALGLLGAFERSTAGEQQPIVLDEIYQVQGRGETYLVIIKIRKVVRWSYDIQPRTRVPEGPEALIVLNHRKRGRLDAGIDYFLLVNAKEPLPDSFIESWNATLARARERKGAAREHLYTGLARNGAERIVAAKSFPLPMIRTPLELVMKIIAR